MELKNWLNEKEVLERLNTEVIKIITNIQKDLKEIIDIDYVLNESIIKEKILKWKDAFFHKEFDYQIDWEPSLVYEFIKDIQEDIIAVIVQYIDKNPIKV